MLSLFKSDARLFNYELNHFNMSLGKIYANNILKHFKHGLKLDIIKLDEILSIVHIKFVLVRCTVNQRT